MKAAALILVAAALLAASLAPTIGAAPSPASSGSSTSSALTVLVFHPDDGVDPLGIPYQGSDPFAVRYGPLVAAKGRFDFPFFVADGVLPIESIPDTGKPYLSALQSYTEAVDSRSHEQAPVSLHLASLVAGSQLTASVSLTPTTTLPGEDLHLWIAVAEDHVHYQPPPGLTNGVTDHRFTVRAVADLGAQDLSSAANATHTFTLDEGWARDRLTVAAWLQQDAPSPRFDAREVVQATHADPGADVVQSGKGVLAEMLSATWCDPCLFGDKAVEDLAVSRGAAEPGAGASAFRYLDWSAMDAVPIVAAVLLGGLIVGLARSRP